MEYEIAGENHTQTETESQDSSACSGSCGAKFKTWAESGDGQVGTSSGEKQRANVSLQFVSFCKFLQRIELKKKKKEKESVCKVFVQNLLKKCIRKKMDLVCEL